MACFPLSKRPAASYHLRPLAFGDPRDNGQRRHAGVDLYAPAGTQILAIEDGLVARSPYPFYAGTDALDIVHLSGMLIRYCEIASANPLRAGDKVKEGQIIAHIGKLVGISVPSDMLHLECYAGTSTGALTVWGAFPFERRADLIDPTAYLDTLPLCLNPPPLDPRKYQL